PWPFRSTVTPSPPETGPLARHHRAGAVRHRGRPRALPERGSINCGLSSRPVGAENSSGTGDLRLCPSGGHRTLDLRNGAIHPNRPVADMLGPLVRSLTGGPGSNRFAVFASCWFVGAPASSGRTGGTATNHAGVVALRAWR